MDQEEGTNGFSVQGSSGFGFGFSYPFILLSMIVIPLFIFPRFFFLNGKNVENENENDVEKETTMKRKRKRSEDSESDEEYDAAAFTNGIIFSISQNDSVTNAFVKQVTLCDIETNETDLFDISMENGKYLMTDEMMHLLDFINNAFWDQEYGYFITLGGKNSENSENSDPTLLFQRMMHEVCDHCKFMIIDMSKVDSLMNKEIKYEKTTREINVQREPDEETTVLCPLETLETFETIVDRCIGLKSNIDRQDDENLLLKFSIFVDILHTHDFFATTEEYDQSLVLKS